MSHPAPDAAHAVAAAWREVLGTDPVPGQSFTDASGDSLQLLRLVFVLEQKVGRPLPLDAFDAEADAAAMARVLDEVRGPAAGVPHPCAVAEAAKVFLFPGAGGDTPGLAGLRLACRPVAEIEVLAYPGWRAMVADRIGVDDLAATLLGHIRAAAPAGAVTLIGYSFGAPLAAEAAFALEDEGREVRRLIVLDMATPRFYPESKHVWVPPASPREVWWELNRVRRHGLTDQRAGQVLAWVACVPRLRPALRRLAAARWPSAVARASGRVGYWTRFRVVNELQLQATTSWARRWRAPARKLRAPVSLVRTSAHPTSTPEALGWTELADRLEVVHVPGDHATMLSTAHLPALAEVMRTALASPG